MYDIRGKRAVSRDVEYYNLDRIISVGYRINFIKVTKFHQWATNVNDECLIVN